MPEERPNFCQEECAGNADCLDNWVCDAGRCLPENYQPNCAEDIECVAVFSGWQTACQSDEECGGAANGTQACVNVDGSGRCANIPNEFFDCAQLQMDQVRWPSIAGGDIDVCAQARAICGDQDFCMLPCRGDADCQSAEYPRCDVETGFCRCNPGTCRTNASVCDEGVCHCQADGDCTEGAVDVCVGGFCGCSGEQTCPAETSHPGTQWVCEPFEAQ